MEYRILIVEDEQGIADAVCAAMSRWGLKAEAVTWCCWISPCPS